MTHPNSVTKTSTHYKITATLLADSLQLIIDGNGGNTSTGDLYTNGFRLVLTSSQSYGFFKNKSGSLEVTSDQGSWSPSLDRSGMLMGSNEDSNKLKFPITLNISIYKEQKAMDNFQFAIPAREGVETIKFDKLPLAKKGGTAPKKPVFKLSADTTQLASPGASTKVYWDASGFKKATITGLGIGGNKINSLTLTGKRLEEQIGPISYCNWHSDIYTYRHFKRCCPHYPHPDFDAQCEGGQQNAGLAGG